MRLIIVSIIFVLLTAACSSGSQTTTDITPPQNNVPSSTATMPPATALPDTMPGAATPAPADAAALPSPTIVPDQPTKTAFTRNTYRQFAILRNDFPDINEATGDQFPSIINAAFSPDGSRIALAGCRGAIDNKWRCEYSSSGILLVLDAETGNLVSSIPVGSGWPGGLSFNSDGSQLLFSTHEHRIVLWDLASNQAIHTFYEREASGATYYPEVAISPSGDLAAAIVQDSLWVWDMTGNLVFKAPADIGRIYGALEFSADGSLLKAFTPDFTSVNLFNTSDWSLASVIPQKGLLLNALSPDAHYLASIDPDADQLFIWDIRSQELISQSTSELTTPSYVQFNPAGDLLIVTGAANLDERDGYSTIGEVYETSTWTKLDNLVSYFDSGSVKFNLDGTRMFIDGYGFGSIWGMPDANLLAAAEAASQFQAALASGDYDTAASLFMATETEAEYLAEEGIDVDDLAGSFANLCVTDAIFCHPVSEIMMTGYDYDDLTVLMRLQALDGNTYAGPQGGTLFTLYLRLDKAGQPRVVYPALE